MRDEMVICMLESNHNVGQSSMEDNCHHLMLLFSVPGNKMVNRFQQTGCRVLAASECTKLLGS